MKNVRRKTPKKLTTLCRVRQNGPTSMCITIKQDIVRKMKLKHGDMMVVTLKKVEMEELVDKAMRSR